MATDVKLDVYFSAFLDFANYKTNPCFCLGEYIDNSLAACSSYGYENTNIQITIIHTNQEKKIIIEDNGCGMTENKLADAVVPGAPTNSTGDSLNAHNRGLKIASFWLSNKFEIETKKEGDNFISYLLIDLTGKNKGDKYNNDFKALPKSLPNGVTSKDHFTKITLLNMWKNKEDLFKEEEEINDIVEMLSFRYKKYLSKGAKISIIWNNKRKELKDDDYLYFNFNNLENDNFKDFFNNQLNKLINENEIDIEKVNKLNDANTGSPEMIKKVDTKSNISVYEWNFENYSEFKFAKECKICNKNDAILIWGLLNTEIKGETKKGIRALNKGNYSKYWGITIFHKDRAIFNSPNLKNQDFPSHNWLRWWTNWSGYEDQSYKRYLAEIDFDESFGIKPDENKQDFIPIDNNNEKLDFNQDLRQAMNDIFNTFNKISQIFLDYENSKKDDNSSTFGNTTKLTEDEQKVLIKNCENRIQQICATPANELTNEVLDEKKTLEEYLATANDTKNITYAHMGNDGNSYYFIIYLGRDKKNSERVNFQYLKEEHMFRVSINLNHPSFLCFSDKILRDVDIENNFLIGLGFYYIFLNMLFISNKNTCDMKDLICAVLQLDDLEKKLDGLTIDKQIWEKIVPKIKKQNE